MSRSTGSDKPRDEALAAWLLAEVGLIGAVSLRQVTGGLSNITSVATDSTGRRVVIRRPPGGVHQVGAHDVLREAHILNALEPSPLPAARVLASVGPEVIGTPFYIMDFVEGTVLASTEDAESVRVPARHGLGLELMGVLVQLQEIDLDEVGLGHLRRSPQYVERQLRRWSTKWIKTAIREVPAVERAAAVLELRAKRLGSRPECLVHGDFRLGNVMIADPEGCSRISALMDWELATADHPLADLGDLGARMTVPAEVLPGVADPFLRRGSRRSRSCPWSSRVVEAWISPTYRSS